MSSTAESGEAEPWDTYKFPPIQNLTEFLPGLCDFVCAQQVLEPKEKKNNLYLVSKLAIILGEV